jgi:hypothetical protein
VHLCLGQGGRALRSEVEDDVGPDLRDDLVHAGAVPDVARQVLRARLPRPAGGDVPAETDQPAGAAPRELRHQRRADAPRTPGHQHDRSAEALRELRLGQAETALFNAKEPGVFDCGLRHCGHQLAGQLAQPGDLDFFKIHLSRRNRAHHRVDDLRNPTHPAAPRHLHRTRRFSGLAHAKRKVVRVTLPLSGKFRD